MAELFDSINGKAILSINDHPTIRKLFKNFNIKTVAITYTVGSVKTRKQSNELIITNWN